MRSCTVVPGSLPHSLLYTVHCCHLLPIAMRYLLLEQEGCPACFVLLIVLALPGFFPFLLLFLLFHELQVFFQFMWKTVQGGGINLCPDHAATCYRVASMNYGPKILDRNRLIQVWMVARNTEPEIWPWPLEAASGIFCDLTHELSDFPKLFLSKDKMIIIEALDQNRSFHQRLTRMKHPKRGDRGWVKKNGYSMTCASRPFILPKGSRWLWKSPL